MNKQEKAAEVLSIKRDLEESEAVYLAGYRGLTVERMSALRAKLREKNGKFRVVKNTLTAKAIDESAYESIKEFLVGPTSVIFCKEDPSGAAKMLLEFAKKNTQLELKAGWMSGQPLSVGDIAKISELPSRDELLAQVLRCIKGPHSGLVNTLIGVHRNILNVLNAIKDTKDS